MNNARIQHLLRQIWEISYELPWLDESFDRKLRDVNEDEMFRRPLKDVHSVAEIMSHLIEWRRELLSRFATGLRNEEMDDRNWIDNQVLRKRGWESLKKSFNETYEDLRILMENHEDDFLDNSYFDKDFGYLLEGWLHHDVYHLGQIGLVLKLLK